jgi:hypothetical protein
VLLFAGVMLVANSTSTVCTDVTCFTSSLSLTVASYTLRDVTSPAIFVVDLCPAASCVGEVLELLNVTLGGLTFTATSTVRAAPLWWTS